MRFGDLTYRQITRLAEAGALVIVPTGCTEQQGPHLPVDFDTWLAETLTLAAANEAASQYGLQVLVLPVMPFGPTPEHRNFGSGFIDLPQPLHEAVVEAVLESLVQQGFKHVLIWRGCGQHDLTAVIEGFNRRHAPECRVVQPDFPYHKIWSRVAGPDIPGGHADSFVTSLALYLRPDVVKEDLIYNPHSDPVDWGDPGLDLASYSESGVIGDPTRASKALGAKLWEATVKDIAATLYEFAQPR